MGIKQEVITLGGGCFWCMEPIFEDLRGVEKVVVGYSGGRLENPSYEQVCTGATGHAEVAQVSFDPEVISLRELLEIFFSVHDPTTLNRQGADVGTQYRSVILYHDEQQKKVAEEVIAGLTRQGLWPQHIVTEVTPFKAFYPAEDYHQHYFENNPYAGYCMAVINPKVNKFKKHYAERLKA